MSESQRAALEAFHRHLHLPFREDARVREMLGEEVAPILEALAFAIESAGRDSNAVEYRDALAMAARLGRRAAQWRITPTALLVCVDALMSGLEAMRIGAHREVERAVRAVVLEGFCAAIEERTMDDVALNAATAIRPLRIAPRCWAIFISSGQAAESLRVALDGACRTMLDDDTRVCLVHVAGTPSDEVASEVFSVDATLRMIGAEAVFTGVDEGWRHAARERTDLSSVVHYEGFDEGLRHALRAVGLEIGETGPLARFWRRLGKDQSG